MQNKYILYLVILLNNLLAQVPTQFLPPPTIPPYKSNVSKDPLLSDLNSEEMSDYLDNYDPGQWQHRFLYQHGNKILKRVELLEKDGKRIVNIAIKGYADGIRNYGIKLRNRNFSDGCEEIAAKEIANDFDLANLRACTYADVLSGLLKSKNYFPLIEFQNPHDEPDYGDSGGGFRKVEVVIHYK